MTCIDCNKDIDEDHAIKFNLDYMCLDCDIRRFPAGSLSKRIQPKYPIKGKL